MKIWTPDERRSLRRLFSRTPDSEIAEALGTTEEEVASEARRLALAKDKLVFKGAPMPRWSPEEIEELRRLYEDHSNVEIARILGRSEASVQRKGSRLGLVKSKLRRAIAGSEGIRLRRFRPVRPDED